MLLVTHVDCCDSVRCTYGGLEKGEETAKDCVNLALSLILDRAENLSFFVSPSFCFTLIALSALFFDEVPIPIFDDQTLTVS